uniref:Calpain catalytic domain-containing protein n=1 Tax=Astatotilapia calliptera TaxID=8154 RepID=A0AAX7SD45_ASTCA
DQSLFYKRQPPPGLSWQRPRPSGRKLMMDCYIGGIVGVCVQLNIEKAQANRPQRAKGVALEGGNTAEALIDFTGGVSEPLSLDREALRLHSDQRRALCQTLTKVHEYKSLITCSIWTVESVLECGLVRGHAYGITAVRKVRLGEKVLKRGGTSRLFMVRMRNPWGTTDWTGAWSQRSEQWQQLSRAERDKMGLVVRDVGEFWMDFEDFCQHFTDVVVCRLVERTLSEKGGGKVNGVWKVELDKRSRRGGCINHRDTFLHNPQFMFEVRAKEEEVLICLQQEDRRMWRKNGKGENLPIGFEVLKVEVNRCSRVQCVVEQAASSIYMDSRSVTLRGTLTLGRYVVLPTTFLLRLFSHSRIRLRGPVWLIGSGARHYQIYLCLLRMCEGNSTWTNCPKCVDRNISGILSLLLHSRCVNCVNNFNRISRDVGLICVNALILTALIKMTENYKMSNQN